MVILFKCINKINQNMSPIQVYDVPDKILLWIY